MTTRTHQTTLSLKASSRAGFTLVEIMVSLVIISLVGVSIVAAFTAAAAVHKRDLDNKDAAQQIERDIASDQESDAQGEVALHVGDYTINGTYDTYTEGSRSYSVIDPEESIPEPVILDGEVAYTSTYTVPRTGQYKLEVWGAAGGAGGYGESAASLINVPGGAGGYSYGTVTLQKGEVLYLHAGGMGKTGTNYNAVAGGENGGGACVQEVSSSNHSHLRHGSGGGASDIRIGTDNLYARVIVAGGGGGTSGAGNDQYGKQGGAGGGLSGKSAPDFDSNRTGGKGGTGSSGGAKGIMTGTNTPETGHMPGSFGSGGTSGTNDNVWSPGAGGGGWYGGGAGVAGTSGGGGSGWLYTEANFSSWNNASDKPNWLLNPAYYLTDADTYDGTWTAIPNPRNDDVTMIGMAGEGYVRITFVG
jgi:prepilin-type N-terminal cleavage/methylation domain-containing protein